MHIVWSAILSWSHVDDIIRIWDIKKGTMSGFKENMNFHKVQEIRFSHTSTHFACSSHLSPRLIPTIYSYLIIISPLCLEGRVLVVFFWQTHQIFSRYSGFLLWHHSVSKICTKLDLKEKRSETIEISSITKVTFVQVSSCSDIRAIRRIAYILSLVSSHSVTFNSTFTLLLIDNMLCCVWSM